MAKRFKLKIYRVLISFRLCRSIKASSLPEIPVPVVHRLSPVNPKALGGGSRNINLPAPPPSTPNFSFIKRHLSLKTASITKHGNADMSSISASRYKEINMEKVKGAASSVDIPNASVPWRRSGCFSSIVAENEETKTLISNSRIFGNDSPFELDDQPLAEDSHVETKKKKNKQNNTDMVKTLRSFGSKKYGRTLSSDKRRTVPPRTAEEKVRGSIAVVKRSEDPCGDFKRSMMEMIVEKQMFEAKDLEKLLQCFLSLNSRQYHGIIVEAFTEIWEALFCKAC